MVRFPSDWRPNKPERDLRLICEVLIFCELILKMSVSPRTLDIRFRDIASEDNNKNSEKKKIN